MNTWIVTYQVGHVRNYVMARVENGKQIVRQFPNETEAEDFGKQLADQFGIDSVFVVQYGRESIA